MDISSDKLGKSSTRRRGQGYESVTYWSRPSCQNRKCTCVNNRCIRSKNIRIWPWMGWMSAICDVHKKVGVELLYNSVHRKFNQLEKRCGRENQHPAEWAPRPLVEQPKRKGKKHCYGHKSGGQYVAVLFGLQLPLTHNPFNKVRGRFF